MQAAKIGSRLLSGFVPTAILSALTSPRNIDKNPSAKRCILSFFTVMVLVPLSVASVSLPRNVPKKKVRLGAIAQGALLRNKSTASVDDDE